MKNCILKNRKPAATFILALIIALTFSTTSVAFIVKNYGGKEMKKEDIKPKVEIAKNHPFSQPTIILI